MAALVVEAECIAAVMMTSGNEIGLLKVAGETITTSLHPSRGRLQRGKSYRVTFEEIECLPAPR